jgi:hypothetical protein
MIKIEVFPFLEISPSELLLTPNMRYTLQIVGGPDTGAHRSQWTDGSHIDIKFTIADSSIASVGKNKEVIGLRVGAT